jgi:hypothetical protein
LALFCRTKKGGGYEPAPFTRNLQEFSGIKYSQKLRGAGRFCGRAAKEIFGRSPDVLERGAPLSLERVFPFAFPLVFPLP